MHAMVLVRKAQYDIVEGFEVHIILCRQDNMNDDQIVLKRAVFNCGIASVVQG